MKECLQRGKRDYFWCNSSRYDSEEEKVWQKLEKVAMAMHCRLKVARRRDIAAVLDFNITMSITQQPTNSTLHQPPLDLATQICSKYEYCGDWWPCTSILVMFHYSWAMSINCYFRSSGQNNLTSSLDSATHFSQNSAIIWRLSDAYSSVFLRAIQIVNLPYFYIRSIWPNDIEHVSALG